MNIKKAVSAFAEAMAAVTMFSVSAFAETTIRLDSEYAGTGAQAHTFLRMSLKLSTAM